MKIGIFSDAHGVIGIFDQSVSLLKDAGAEKIFYLGDAIGYVPHLGCLRSWIVSELPSVRGNHEEMLLAGSIPDERDKIYQLAAIRHNLTSQELDFIDSLPDQLIEEISGLRCLFIHGSPSDYVKGYVYEDTDLAQFEHDMSDVDVVFMGNTHRPFVKRFKQTLYVNVGSCGLPRGESQFGQVCLFDAEAVCAEILSTDLRQVSMETLAHTNPAESVKKYLHSYLRN